MKKKIKIGIDINEVLRARWLQFDKYYVEEFGEEGVPKGEPYVCDFFKEYEWKDTVEKEKILNEDFPEDINPLDYQVDDKTGEAPVDFLAFKTKKNKLTAKEVYNRFMYEDYLYEIHGAARSMNNKIDVHVEKLLLKYKDHADFIVLSQENWFSIPPTLFFLSKIMSRCRTYQFIQEDKQEMWDFVDILITADPEILDAGVPEGKQVIKLQRPYNVKCQDGAMGEAAKDMLQINDLTDSTEFEKIMNYTTKEEENE